MNPSRSAASIIATPIRSLTEPPGLKNSSFATTSPGRSPARRGSTTSGVLPTTAELSAPTRRAVTVASVPAMREKLTDPGQFSGDCLFEVARVSDPGRGSAVPLLALLDRGLLLRPVVPEL